MAYKYFHYSVEQLKFMKEMEKRRGRNFRVGTVFNKGRRLSFTEISSNITSRYSDDKVVAEGEESKFKYTPPRSV